MFFFVFRRFLIKTSDVFICPGTHTYISRDHNSDQKVTKLGGTNRNK